MEHTLFGIFILSSRIFMPAPCRVESITFAFESITPVSSRCSRCILLIRAPRMLVARVCVCEIERTKLQTHGTIYGPRLMTATGFPNCLVISFVSFAHSVRTPTANTSDVGNSSCSTYHVSEIALGGTWQSDFMPLYQQQQFTLKTAR